MKAKLTVTIDRDLVLEARRLANERGVSLSALIEAGLRMTLDSPETLSFAARWRGAFVPADRGDTRYRALERKHG